MPHASIHQRQRRKNFLLMAVLAAVVVIFFSMTVVKLGSKPAPEAPAPAQAQ